MNKIDSTDLERFGFNFEPGSALTKRTTMTGELSTLFKAVPNLEASLADYKTAIIEDNCLAKRTLNNRGYSFTYLKRLYGLSPEFLIFRALRYFFSKEEQPGSLLYLLTAYSRDQILRASSSYILALPIGSPIVKADFEDHMDQAFPGRFGTKMLQSLVRNLNSAWSQSGHLSGTLKRARAYAEPDSGAVSLALLLGYLSGARGLSLFHTEYIKLLDCSFERSLELAEGASRKSWIRLQRIGDVIEVRFPNLINSQETEWISEQN